MLTFPGIILHEISHQLLCDILNVPVYEVVYFNFNSTQAGHVIHERTEHFGYSLLIALAPLFINSIICMLFTLPFTALGHITHESMPSIFNRILFWIGISAGIHAFPSNQDVTNVLNTVQENTHAHGFTMLICHLMRILNWLRRFGSIIYMLLV